MSETHHTFVILDKTDKSTPLNALLILAEGLSKLTENATYVVYHAKDRGQLVDQPSDYHTRIPALPHDYREDNDSI